VDRTNKLSARRRRFPQCRTKGLGSGLGFTHRAQQVVQADVATRRSLTLAFTPAHSFVQSM
jgi:hypothetical protein